jgi:hypothetical protein
MIAAAGGERRKHFSDAQLFIAPSLPSVFLMADPAPSHAPRSGARRKILRLLAITPSTTQRADAPLAPEGLAQRRAADSGPRRAGVALHHDVPHATSPVGDTVEALYAERNDRQIRLLQVGKATPRLVLDNVFTVAAARPEPVLKYHSIDRSRRRTDRSCGRLPKGDRRTLLVEATDSSPGIAGLQKTALRS